MPTAWAPGPRPQLGPHSGPQRTHRARQREAHKADVMAAGRGGLESSTEDCPGDMLRGGARHARHRCDSTYMNVATGTSPQKWEGQGCREPGGLGVEG